MFLNNSFGKTVEMMSRGMDVTLFRRDVISDNMANSDTPNFKRSTVNFEAELKRALDSEQAKPALPAKMTDSRHIPFFRPQNYLDVKPRKVLDYLSTTKNNGNNVDVETEMMDAMENQLMYQTMVQAVNHQFQQVSMVLKG